MKLLKKIEDKMSFKGEKGLLAVWKDEGKMLEACRKMKDEGFKHFDAITPFPMHEVDEVCGRKRSFIPWITLICGLTGCSFGVWFTWWTSAVDWPLIVGGKPFWSLPAFIPIIFELTILFSALGSVGALFFVCGLPKVNPPVGDKDLTCHKFGVFVSSLDKKYDFKKVEGVMKPLSPEKIKEVRF